MVEGLPASFGDLTGIVHLDLSCNKIDLDHLPNSFFGKEMLLERLYLSDNNITEVSENFSQLVNLKILALRYVISKQLEKCILFRNTYLGAKIYIESVINFFPK